MKKTSSSRRSQLTLRDLHIARGYKAHIALVLYALIRTGKILNRQTQQPMTILDFSRLLRDNDIDINVRNLCHRVILHPDDPHSTTKFLRDIISTIEENTAR